ncbi:PTS sugar transporter subunit IIA [Clostridium estertheticum]|uniref:PTS sugar transporter subunit IIA n=1 Tax=Clostridium estertheticum TaxID=238834 RepID=UPI001C7D396A|nr:PTS sugar transporter subunit IIA [Clostridium estertheticum]MBX4265088.1 PTS sugar transporter subunit IIA [Clostridium estertheticum]MBX4268523.1 PTS sugar transporter subunit IIA [Clostridium estertheticum]WLC81418.1 PTS sugar transporter subunit IIA [Clostridium estertheticum]WLC88550.1 PTS sugar transporter subunit IIA [Clostridium estertheticum]
MDLAKVIKKETIKLEMEATTKDEALRELVELLFENNKISDKEAFLEDVLYRESLGTTGIGNYIAIPHGKSKFVNKTSLALGRTKQDIEWETLDGLPVRFIILFAVTDEDKTSVHVRLLAKVASTLGDDDACAKLLVAKTNEEILNIFSAGEEN